MKTRNLILLSILIIIFQLSNKNSVANFCDPKSQQDSLKTLNSQLDGVIDQTFTELLVPGAIIGIWVGGYEPYKRTLGVSDLITKTPMAMDDHVRIGSITKTFTGTVFLQLVDEGKISLSDKLSKYFDWPNGDNINIEQVGNMRSGIYNYSEDPVFGDELLKNLTMSFTPQQVLDIAKKHEPYFAPGTSMHYSNTNFILLGLIIEKITGNSLGSEIHNRILQPLGMTHSVLAMNTDFPMPHAHGYMYMDSTSVSPTDITVSNPSWGWAAGSMISTLDDISKYAKPLAIGGLISEKTQAERLKWETVFSPPGGAWANKQLKYGFAIADFEGAIGHNGGIPGFNSFMGYYPEKDATILIFVNMQDNKAGIGPADYLANKILAKIKSF